MKRLGATLVLNKKKQRLRHNVQYVEHSRDQDEYGKASILIG